MAVGTAGESGVMGWVVYVGLLIVMALGAYDILRALWQIAWALIKRRAA